MKLNTFWHGTLRYKLPNKWLLVMKITFVLLLATFMTVSAGTLAQKITLNTTDAHLKTILKEFKKQSGYNFVIDEQLLDNTKTVTLHLKEATIDQALEQAFQNQQLTYTLVDKVVTIKEKEPSILDKLKSALTLNTIDVTGQVVDETGKGLPGATVIVKGTGNSTITDAKGNFTLKHVDGNAVLVISFIGYEKKEISATADLGIIKLSQSTNQLDAVQVIAYGQTTQRLSTGDISTVYSKDIEKQSVNNPLLALEGRITGLLISQSTGLPGSGVKLNIQGQNSIGNGNDALYVIDGVPYASELLPNFGSVLGLSGSNNVASNGNPLSYINPADIESISVLKDADATSIYGSRAANGAILITTKKGKAGETKVDFNLQDGWGSVGHFLSLLNTQQYLQMRKEAYFTNDGYSTNSSSYPQQYDLNGLWDQSRNTDWQKTLIGGSAKYNDFNGSISGGSGNTQFLFGVNYHRETTVFPDNFSDRKGGIHFNINNVSNNQKFRFQFSTVYLLDNNQLPEFDLTKLAETLAPDAPSLYNKDGSINWAPNQTGATTWQFPGNPIAALQEKYANNTNNLVSNATFSYALTQGLQIKSSFGYTKLQTNEIVTIPLSYYAPETRSYQQRTSVFVNNDSHSWIMEPQLTYNKTFGNGKLEALLGTTIEQNNSNGQQFFGLGFNSDQQLTDLHSANTVIDISSISSIYKYNALFGRLNYNLNDKYIVNLTARRDGSSRFGPENEFHNFESAGLAWIFSNENFVKKDLAPLSFGKLRVSYGTTGNDQIPDYQFLSLYSPTGAQPAYQGISTLQPNGLTNPYLQWELTKKLELGLDLGFLNDRIFFNAAYFRNRSSNQLISTPQVEITGFTSITENLPAIVQNKGWEFVLKSTNIKSDNFSWTSEFNLTLPKNKLIDFPNLESSVYANSLVIGQPIGTQKVFHFLGVNPQTGLYQFSGKNGPTSNPNAYLPAGENDNTTLINTAPTAYGGFVNNFHFKRFELSMVLQFVKQKGPNYKFAGYPPGVEGENQPVFVLGAWQKPGDLSKLQKYNSDYSDATSYFDAQQSDAAFSDASFIRLKNISISWQIPTRWQESVHLKNASLFIQGQNLITFTHYVGLDPETLSTTTLPPLRVITMGILIGL